MIPFGKAVESVRGRALLGKGAGLRSYSLEQLPVWCLLPEYEYNVTTQASAPTTLPSCLPFWLPCSPHLYRLYHSKVVSQNNPPFSFPLSLSPSSLPPSFGDSVSLCGPNWPGTCWPWTCICLPLPP